MAEIEESKLWTVANKLRLDRQMDPIEAIRMARENGISEPTALIGLLRKFIVPRQSVLITPQFVTRFVQDYLRDKSVDTVLDPLAGIGASLLPLIEHFEPSRAVAIAPHTKKREVIQELDLHDRIQLVEGEPISALGDMSTRFDVVVSVIPFGMQSQELTLKSPDGTIQVKDEEGHLTLLKSATLLSEQGTGFFIVRPDFMSGSSSRSVRKNLMHWGLSVSAALSLPAGVFAPTTTLPGLLLIVNREMSEELFVAQLTPDRAPAKAMLRNLKTRRAGRKPHLGALVSPSTFISFDVLLAQYEIHQMVQRQGLEGIPLAKISTDIEFVRSGDVFEERRNAVYLPLVGTSPAVDSIEDLTLKHHNYAQLVLMGDQADATYIANFFNKPLGRKLRESLQSGSTIPRISRSSLRSSEIFIPDLDTQRRVVAVADAVADLQTQLDTLQEELWRKPRQSDEIRRNVEQLNKKRDLEAWLDQLPFPLGSILWGFQAESNIEHKVQHLLFFFEALAEFNATLMLSAMASDEDFYRENCTSWLDGNPQYREWYLKSSFGDWRILATRLAKATRRYRQKNKAHCFELYGHPNPSFMEMLVNKDVYKELDTVNRYRNEWQGHHGYVPDQKHREHLALLRQSLSNVRRTIANNYSTAKLLIPGESVYRDGVFTYTVKHAKGARYPFKEITVETTVPLDEKSLYLLHENQVRPIELIPIVRFMPSTSEQRNACYFYNRMDGEDVRWIAYHFEDRTDVTRKDDLRIKSELDRLLKKEGDSQ